MYSLRAVGTVSAVFVGFLIAGCASILQVDRADEKMKNDEFEKKVEVKVVKTPPPETKPPEVAPEVAKKQEPKNPVKTKVKNPPPEPVKGKPKVSGPRQPSIEDSEGFDGRRPIKDPYRVGEKVTLGIRYLKMEGGTLDMETRQFVEVNGQKAYNFTVTAKSNSLFSNFYAVDDQAVTYVGYDNLVPLSLQISIKESKQLAETRTFFDWKEKKANYWQKKITKEKGEESKKLNWDIPEYSHNVVSVAYYLRAFKLDVGKKLAIRVADEGKNIVFTGEVLRKEKLSTDIGVLDTVVIRPTITADGVFKPIGDILIWMTDDDRKFLVRLEAKIKIGTIVATLKSIEKGQD